jgi:hypothetical protein
MEKMELVDEEEIILTSGITSTSSSSSVITQPFLFSRNQQEQQQQRLPRKRTVEDVWEVQALRNSLEGRSSSPLPLFWFLNNDNSSTSSSTPNNNNLGVVNGTTTGTAPLLALSSMGATGANSAFLPTPSSKRQKHRVYVLVKTVSGRTIRIEAPEGLHVYATNDINNADAMNTEETLLTIGDIKRSLREEYGLNLENTTLLLDRKNVSEMDGLYVENGSTLYAVLKVGGCSPAKPLFMGREYMW